MCTCTMHMHMHMHNALMLVWGYVAQVRPNDQPYRLGLCLHCLIVPRACIGVRSWRGGGGGGGMHMCHTPLIAHGQSIACKLFADSRVRFLLVKKLGPSLIQRPHSHTCQHQLQAFL